MASVGHMLRGSAELAQGASSAAFNWVRLRELAEIPDIGAEIASGRLSWDVILRIRELSQSAAFRTWFHDANEAQDADIAREYAALLRRVPGLQSTPLRILRFLATTGVGLMPGVGTALGAIASAVDSFLLEPVANRRNPRLFLDKLESLVRRERRRPPSQ